MRPGQRRFSRRALLVGAGAATAYGLVRLFELDGGIPPAVAPSGPRPPPTDSVRGEQVDLTVRWRDLQTTVQRPGLVAAWQFNESAGYAFADATSNAHVLYPTGTRWNTTDSGLLGSLHRQGLRGGAVWLDGSRWLQTDFAWDLLAPAGLTVACRVRPQRPADGSAVLVGYGSAYQLTLDPSGALAFTLLDGDGVVHAVRSPAGAAPPQTWTHLCAVADPEGGTIALYVDGQPTAHTVTGPFRLVPRLQRTTLGTRFVGLIDEATIHNEPLDASDVHTLATVGLPTVYTQSSATIDDEQHLFTRFHGSDPVPHPAVAGTAALYRFSPDLTPGARPLAPGVFGAAWRATAGPLVEPSPMTGDSATFEAWLRPIADPSDPARLRRKDVFVATGASGSLTLYTEGGRWCFDLRRPHAAVVTRRSAPHPFLAGVLEHVGLTWGRQADGRSAVILYANGSPCAETVTRPGQTSFGSRISIGGSSASSAYLLFDDIRISDNALPWGEICPRGQAAAGVAGLDLRDRFSRPPGAGPMLWRPGSPSGRWSHQVMDWRDPEQVGDDSASSRALFQASPSGVEAVYHPDAFGYRSSIEAGVSFESVLDGWAGLFVQSPAIGGAFTGLTFMVNPERNSLRLARYLRGQVQAEKVVPYDFAMRAHATYELTLTNPGDGIVRGFVEGSNVISLRTDPDWPTVGHAGLLTDGAAAYFSDLHFCALTPAGAASRAIRTRTIPYGEDVSVSSLTLTPFRWSKRPGLLPWQYTTKDPEPAGAIAGAATRLPPRPIPSQAWRSEDSANADLVTIDDTMWFFMRGNPRVDNRAGTARIGVLHTAVSDFDALHFTDPSDLLVPPSPHQLNAPATAYVGDGRLLFLGREFAAETDSAPPVDTVVYSRFDVRTAAWEMPVPAQMAWGRAPAPDASPTEQTARLIHGSPEVVALREPDFDTYRAVVFQQTGPPGQAVMATALLSDVSAGVPALAPGMAVHTSLARPSGRAIYGFRVLFDNGIYYLHYNEGPHVPDWPDRFVLAAALDPYAGPWVASPTTLPETSTYFRRGSALRPDNGAIWQGTMVKHRGRYYLYYECYHSIGDVDAPYAEYASPQAGSRIGFATA